MSLCSQYVFSVCEPFSRELILHSLHIFLLLLSTIVTMFWRHDVTSRTSPMKWRHGVKPWYYIWHTSLELSPEGILVLSLFIHSLSWIRRRVFDCQCTLSSTKICTLLIEWLLELKCVASGLSLLSLMSRRCSSSLSFSCLPVSPTFTTLSPSVHVSPYMTSLSVHVDDAPVCVLLFCMPVVVEACLSSVCHEPMYLPGCDLFCRLPSILLQIPAASHIEIFWRHVSH